MVLFIVELTTHVLRPSSSSCLPPTQRKEKWYSFVYHAVSNSCFSLITESLVETLCDRFGRHLEVCCCVTWVEIPSYQKVVP
mmetsp:Transcript_58888/g.68089  ORF Transcript_58888/g.68089 Transcript_58888/m.68089 type:complete len:82 (-) Transcript_58888:408-653(-)